jgi:hypothetical protein
MMWRAKQRNSYDRTYPTLTGYLGFSSPDSTAPLKKCPNSTISVGELTRSER